MKKLILFLLCLSTLACSPAKLEEEVPTDGMNSSEKLDMNTYNYKACQGEVPPNMSLYKSAWLNQYLSKGSVFVQEIVRFEPGSIQKQVICTHRETTVTVTARANAGWDEAKKELLVTSNDNQTKTLPVGSEVFNCVSKLEATNTLWKYSYEGVCLNMINSDLQATFTPTR